MATADEDALVLTALREGGADLAWPRRVRHYLRFDSAAAAEAARAALPAGYRGELAGERLVVAHELALDEGSLARARAELSALGGEYEAWDAASDRS